MNVNSNGKIKLSSYYRLIDRIQKLLQIMKALAEQNNELKNKIIQLEQRREQNQFDGEYTELERVVKRLKKENKILKEKERAIKTKIERLAVKLEEIHF